MASAKLRRAALLVVQGERVGLWVAVFFNCPCVCSGRGVGELLILGDAKDVVAVLTLDSLAAIGRRMESMGHMPGSGNRSQDLALCSLLRRREARAADEEAPHNQATSHALNSAFVPGKFPTCSATNGSPSISLSFRVVRGQLVIVLL